MKTHNLRDHMSEAELIFTALAELSTRQLAESVEATGMKENADAGKKGGGVARRARKDLEDRTGRKVVTGDNFLPPAQSRQTIKCLHSFRQNPFFKRYAAKNGIFQLTTIVFPIVDCSGKGGVVYFLKVCHWVGISDFYAIWDKDDDVIDCNNVLKKAIETSRGIEFIPNLELALGLPTGKEPPKSKMLLIGQRILPGKYSRNIQQCQNILVTGLR